MNGLGTIEQLKSIADFDLRYAKKKQNGSLLISGRINKATSIDTVVINFEGGSDALSLSIDSSFRTIKRYRLATPYFEYMHDADIFKDSLFSLAYTAQTVPSLYSNRPSLLDIDKAPDAFLSSGLVGEPVVLPVLLISFSAIKKENVVYLSLSAISRDDATEYIFQRSLNGSNYTNISVRYSLPSAHIITYRENDDLIEFGKYLYRVQVIAKDGKTSYSNIARIAYSPRESAVHYDNTSNEIHILRNNSNKYNWRIFDGSGRLIFADRKTVGALTIDVSRYPKGQYIIHLTEANLTNRIYKFIR